MQSGAASLTETQVSTGDAGVSPAVNGQVRLNRSGAFMEVR